MVEVWQGYGFAWTGHLMRRTSFVREPVLVCKLEFGFEGCFQGLLRNILGIVAAEVWQSGSLVKLLQLAPV